MLDLIQKVLGKDGKKNDRNVPTDQDMHVALCVLMLEAAHADGECSADEMANLMATLTAKCSVARTDIDELVDLARKKREDTVDLFSFTRYLNHHYSKQEKILVMEAVWRVILIDGQLEKHEDHFAHKLANLLRLTHKELINAKIRARGELNS